MAGLKCLKLLCRKQDQRPYVPNASLVEIKCSINDLQLMRLCTKQINNIQLNSHTQRKTEFKYIRICLGNNFRPIFRRDATQHSFIVFLICAT